jgi:septum site-determining protein MinC
MVTLKGTKEGLVITLGEGDWPEILTELVAKLERPSASTFFRGAFARVEPEGWTMTESQSQELAVALQAHGMQLDRRKYAGLPVLVPSPSSRTANNSDVVETEPESVATERDATALEDDNGVGSSTVPSRDGNEHELWSEAAIVRRTVRSGQSIRYPGHVVVYGDVNPGGEIVAGGDVIVWGKLHGTVHAGATGDDRAIVGALQLAAIQLRIGKYIARAPDTRTQKTMGVEVARVRNDRIVIEDWTPHRDWSPSHDWWQSLISGGRLRLFGK